MTTTNARVQRACSMVLRAATESAVTGRTSEYFERERWESDLRHGFAEARQALGCRTGEDRAKAIKMFEKLNRYYNTRHKADHLRPACNTILDRIPRDATNLNLFDLSDDGVPALGNTVTQALVEIGASGQKCPFSLATKFLHFLFPDLFVIYDSQAAYSVWMWSLFAVGDDQPESQTFLASRLTDTSGTGYPAMLQFYRTLWRSCSDADRDSARKATGSLEAMLRSQPGSDLARVTVLDLIDKHLWMGAGNPIRLGLAATP